MPWVTLNPPFRGEHCGSLKRPLPLLEKRQLVKEGKLSQQELTAAEDEAIKAAVKMQMDVGIKAITDGEIRRAMFYDGVFDNLDGMKVVTEDHLDLFMDYIPMKAAFKIKGPPAASICVGKIKRTKPFYGPDFDFLKTIVPEKDHKGIKITMGPPSYYHLRLGTNAYSKDVYSTDEEYFADLTKAYREEIADLYSRGCRNVQIDDPGLAYFCDVNMVKGMKDQGLDPDYLLNLYIQAYKDCLSEKPAGMNIGLHLCRGNYTGGQHFSQGGYDDIAIKLFNEIPVDTYYLEYDSDRAGTFEPLKHLPKNKVVVLGLVTSKAPELEDMELLKKRIDSAAETIANGVQPRSKAEALNQICISPQCGFASSAAGNPVSEQNVVDKLSLVVKTAKEVWVDA
ncbi:UROD/MetE-like protein [Stereum hirsutum FP-91666 SS1]|uniref:UROD/MetE-like protein n=1 Tax=Stereum hirsutum (strain FP-91666) TaxID=721885 RepID=UPI000440C891|nr:UROD/MetE-like protein [Stereum hirsutum FP-91666 SS1]EIM91548.1 UROD/MetE-like protein [Stereum hirsutum FP-91666 SS1]